MYLLKQLPEDFVVKEIATHKTVPSGPYALCILTKRNYTTYRAIQAVASKLGKPVKYISFAGNKDKSAVTSQYIAIKFGSEQDITRLDLKDISLTFVGYTSKPLSIGELTANHFDILIRNLTPDEINRLQKAHSFSMPNYFGEQRFSGDNAAIGKMLVKSQFKEASELILSTNPDAAQAMRDYLEHHPSNPIEALRLLPRKQLKLYVHSYQSLLWNRMLHTSTSKGALFVPGFGTEDPELVKMLSSDGISPRDFISRKMPELASEGTNRSTHAEIRDFKVQLVDSGVAAVSFSLPKGSYATVAIPFLLDELEDALKDYL